MNKLQQAQSAVADLARAGSDLDALKASVRALAFDKQDADEARRVLRKDRARSVDYDVLDKICAVLDCEPGDLIVRISDEPKAKRKA